MDIKLFSIRIILAVVLMFAPGIGTAGTRAASASGAPSVTSVGCPSTATAGQAITCSPAITGSVTSVSWFSIAGSPSTGAASTFTTTFSHAGTGYVIVKACNNTECAYNYEKITVSEAPTLPKPVITSLGCPATATAGQAITCNPTVTGVVTSRSWKAYIGTPATGNGQTFSTTFDHAGDGYVRLEVCNGQACVHDYAKVTVTGLPKPVIVSLGCPSTAVAGQSVTCTSNVTGTVISLKWYTTAGTPSTGSSPTFNTTFAHGGTATVKLEACNGMSCNSSYANITVTAPLAPTITSLGCPSTATASHSITCTPSVSGQVTAWHWNASNASSAAGNTSSFTTTFSSAGKGYVRLEVCNGPSCTHQYQEVQVKNAN